MYPAHSSTPDKKYWYNNSNMFIYYHLARKMITHRPKSLYIEDKRVYN
jgi:hypothetical protein